jgi:hypothetical protein
LWYAHLPPFLEAHPIVNAPNMLENGVLI